jgi:hypothetical protein
MSTSVHPRIAILTLAIGADYRRDLAACLESKRAYATAHGYELILAGEEYWDRSRPIAWSKVPFWLDVLRRRAAEFDFLFISDADVLMTNLKRSLDFLIVSLGDKDLMLTRDACGNINSGNMLLRCSAAKWLIDYFERVWAKTDDLYHIWWENKAMLDILAASPVDLARVKLLGDHKAMNAYIQGAPGEPLWEPGDLLVHFAGVYDTGTIRGLVEAIGRGEVPRLAVPAVRGSSQ